MKTIISDIFKTVPIEKQEIIANYAMGDLRKLGFIEKLCDKKPELIDDQVLKKILNAKTFNEDTNKITQTILYQWQNLMLQEKFLQQI